MTLLRVTYNVTNLGVTKQVVTIFRVSPFGVPTGMLPSLFTAAGQLLGSTAADTPSVIPAPTVEGDLLVARLGQNAKMKWETTSLSPVVLPSTRLNDFNQSQLINYLTKIHAKNVNIEFKVGTYTHGITAVTLAYSGAVFSPTQNRIYLIPYAQANQTNWHYIDCESG